MRLQYTLPFLKKSMGIMRKQAPLPTPPTPPQMMNHYSSCNKLNERSSPTFRLSISAPLWLST